LGRGGEKGSTREVTEREKMGTDEEGQKKTGKGMSTEMGQRMPEGVGRGGGKADGMRWAGEGREEYEKGVVVMETSIISECNI